MATLSLRNVDKIYDNNVQAVFGFTLDIQDKEFIVFVGPSGCGKSTTLRMIAGLEDISAGELYIDDQLMNDVAPKDRNIAMVFQSYALYPHMTVYENMAFGLRLRKVPKDVIDQKVKVAAEKLGLTPYLQRKPKALSGGQRQRVALGRAIVRDAKVFLMDEPLSNLDAKLRVQMRSELIRLHNSLATTTIYVTHDQIEAMTMATRIVCMKDGRVQQIGSPKELYSKPANKFVAGFMGSPAMNFITGTVTAKGEFDITGDEKHIIKLPEEKFALLKNFVDRQVILGIRPEDIKYSEDRDFAGETIVPLNCEADVVELLGDTLQIHSLVNNQKFVCKTSSIFDVRMHDKVTLGFDMNMVHFFDAVSGVRITSSEQKPVDGDVVIPVYEEE
jgi:multiple sugar transport system ATP-binding protein